MKIDKKEICKKMIGTCVFDKRRKRKGTLDSIAFNNKDYTICWFMFQWESGAYLVSTKDVVAVNESKQLTLFN